MRDWKGKTYWIVGASEGLGRAVAEALSRLGVSLVVSARSGDRLDELVEALPGRARAVEIDVTDQKSVEAAAAEAGEIDGMVYLAGVYWPMESQEWNTEQAVAMTEVNYIGAQRVLGAVLPAMLERDAGHIVLTGSPTGFRGLPGGQGYIPSKSAVMSMAECLNADLRNTGIDVQLVNPGFIRTRLTDKNDFEMPFIMDPEPAADHVVAAMTAARFQTNFPRVFSWVFRASQFLPAPLYFRLFGAKG